MTHADLLRAARRDREVTPEAYVVLAEVLDDAAERGGVSGLLVPDLAERLAMAPRTVERALAALDERGFLWREGQGKARKLRPGDGVPNPANPANPATTGGVQTPPTPPTPPPQAELNPANPANPATGGGVEDGDGESHLSIPPNPPVGGVVRARNARDGGDPGGVPPEIVLRPSRDVPDTTDLGEAPDPEQVYKRITQRSAGAWGAINLRALVGTDPQRRRAFAAFVEAWMERGSAPIVTLVERAFREQYGTAEAPVWDHYRYPNAAARSESPSTAADADLALARRKRREGAPLTAEQEALLRLHDQPATASALA